MTPTLTVRPQAAQLADRLTEPRRLILAVLGPRQVGKTTLVQELLAAVPLPSHYASADEPTLRGRDWIEEHWQAARLEADAAGQAGMVLVLDEVHKIPGWSESVMRLWDEDTAAGRSLKVVLLGSAPPIVAGSLRETLAGRYETFHLPHWSLPEMQAAFGWSLDEYVFHGAYPGVGRLIGQPGRWFRTILDSLIETTLSRDVLLLSRVDKPALLRQLFELACRTSGQILSYTQMLRQLPDAGNTTTLAHYLDLLSAAGLVSGLQKYVGPAVRRRGSSPKLQVLNTALMTAPSGLSPAQARSDPELWGRLVESAVGAHLLNAAAAGLCQVYYWRDVSREVDFVVVVESILTAIEVRSGRPRKAPSGVDAFAARFGPVRKLLIGGEGIPLQEFLSRDVEHWVGG